MSCILFFFQVILPHSLFKQKGERLKQAETLFKFSFLSASNHPGNPSRAGSHSNSAHLPLAPNVGEAWLCSGQLLGQHENMKPEPVPWSTGEGWALLAQQQAGERFLPILIMFRWIHLSLCGLSADTVCEGSGTP